MEQSTLLVIECPDCGERYLLSNNNNSPSENAKLFSDGFFIDEINWRTPGIIGCVTCELGFLSDKGKVIAEIDYKEYLENWSHIKKAEPPSAGNLALELRIRKKMIPETEKIIRKEFWYAGTHSEKGKIQLSGNDKFRSFFYQSLEILKDMMDITIPEELILKAEILRQMGEFDKCINLLNSQKNNVADQIKNEALRGNRNVFILTK